MAFPRNISRLCMFILWLQHTIERLASYKRHKPNKLIHSYGRFVAVLSSILLVGKFIWDLMMIIWYFRAFYIFTLRILFLKFESIYLVWIFSFMVYVPFFISVFSTFSLLVCYLFYLTLFSLLHCRIFSSLYLLSFQSLPSLLFYSSCMCVVLTLSFKD